MILGHKNGVFYLSYESKDLSFIALRDVVPQYERQVYSNLEMGNNKLHNISSSSKIILYQEFEKKYSGEYLTNILLGDDKNVTIYYASYDNTWDGQSY